jgi:hypothetical protein
MDSGHLYQAALLYLLKLSVSMHLKQLALWHQFCHDDPKARDSLGAVTLLQATLTLV